MKNNFAELYAEYQKMIERYVHYKISNHADAEDILQDVAMAAYNNFTKLSDITNFKQWLIGIDFNIGTIAYPILLYSRIAKSRD